MVVFSENELTFRSLTRSNIVRQCCFERRSCVFKIAIIFILWSTEAREAVQNYSIYNMPQKTDSAYMHTLHGLIHTLMRTVHLWMPISKLGATKGLEEIVVNSYNRVVKCVFMYPSPSSQELT